MQTIIRIEHPKSGYGIFRTMDYHIYGDKGTGWDYLHELKCNEALVQRHCAFPLPQREGFEMHEDDFCAFKSIEQIQQWIEPEWFIELIDAGFKIHAHDVFECIETEYQIIFKKIHIISTKDITQLFL